MAADLSSLSWPDLMRAAISGEASREEIDRELRQRAVRARRTRQARPEAAPRPDYRRAAAGDRDDD